MCVLKCCKASCLNLRYVSTIGWAINIQNPFKEFSDKFYGFLLCYYHRFLTKKTVNVPMKNN